MSAEMFLVGQRNGECIGILKACLFIISHNVIKKAIIFSDCKSALEAIVRNPFQDKLRSPIISQIRDCLYTCSQRETEVVLAWIPGHYGITGNEFADAMAKDAISNNADRKYFLSNHMICFTYRKQTYLYPGKPYGQSLVRLRDLSMPLFKEPFPLNPGFINIGKCQN